MELSWFELGFTTHWATYSFRNVSLKQNLSSAFIHNKFNNSDPLQEPLPSLALVSVVISRGLALRGLSDDLRALPRLFLKQMHERANW